MNVFREFMEGVFSNPDNNKIFEFLLNFKSCFLSVGANLLLAQTFVPSFLPLSLSLSLSVSCKYRVVEMGQNSPQQGSIR